MNWTELEAERRYLRDMQERWKNWQDNQQIRQAWLKHVAASDRQHQRIKEQHEQANRIS